MILLETPVTQIPSWIVILTSIIGSGAFAAIVSIITNQQLKKVDYKYDYKKYILQKRKDAYNDIEKLLVILGEKQISRITKARRHNIFTESTSSANPIDSFMKLLSSTLGKNRFWITENMDDLLVELLQFLNSYSSLEEFKDKTNISLSELSKLAEANFDKVETFEITINNQFFEDIKYLDDIENFKKSKHRF